VFDAIAESLARLPVDSRVDIHVNSLGKQYIKGFDTSTSADRNRELLSALFTALRFVPDQFLKGGVG
jgi:hypothetical protein